MLSIRIISASYIALFCSIPLAISHVVQSEPAPRYDDDDMLKEYPCGEGDQYNAFDMGPLTQLEPGWQAITFRETVNHPSAPYRLALSFETDDFYDTHVLMDQIPHNDDGDIDKYHRVWVDIPNVDCVNRNCALQVIQVMVGKFEGVCAPEDLAESCGDSSYVYFSCANVEIVGNSTEWPPADFYVSYDGATSPAGWDALSTEWVQADDGIWELPGQSGIVTDQTDMHWTTTTTLLVVIALICLSFGLLYMIYHKRREDHAALVKSLQTRQDDSPAITPVHSSRSLISP